MYHVLLVLGLLTTILTLFVYAVNSGESTRDRALSVIGNAAVSSMLYLGAVVCKYCGW